MSDTITAYRMNPAEDIVIYGDELSEGMLVIPASESARAHGQGEDARLRGERFRCVTRLRRTPQVGMTPTQTVFIAEWVDGYQEMHSYGETHGWIVKRESLPAAPDGAA